ncbi:MAG TPA: DNA-3-methyladenine glycosylase [Myxococcaceae bacterium]|nr:DNA-3-methyladenine glycosylase [Myxococcaceae bacterium]
MAWTVNIALASGVPLPHSFYARPARVVARALLGKVLVHAGRAGRIVETEAYVGAHDLACHAARGKTARTGILWGPPGRAYVYFIYGMHWCFNAVTEREGRPGAVLVRGLEPLAGFDGPVRLDGPARLCRALDISGTQNGLDLTSSALRILDAPAVRGRDVERGPRIGVDYAGKWALAPLRYWVRGSPGVSRGRRSVAVP